VLVALILVSIGFAVTLGILLFGNRSAHALPPTGQGQLEAETRARAAAEAELERKRKEMDEQRLQLQDVKGQLKETKRKLFELKEVERTDRDLLKARAEVERDASVQLETVRAELAHALAEVERLKAERGAPRERPVLRSVPAPAPVAAAAVAEPVVAPPAPVPASAAAAAETAPAERGARRFRELNDADREKMERLEHVANKERGRAGELERELRRLKGRTETQHRIYTVTKGELDLLRDKFKALEKRLNRTLLERDLLKRALRDLERKTGAMAERTELTPDEIAASDRKVEEAAAAEVAAAASQGAGEPGPTGDAAPGARSGEAPAGLTGEEVKPSDGPTV
jgi:chromosome segregation ATPase